MQSGCSGKLLIREVLRFVFHLLVFVDGFTFCYRKSCLLDFYISFFYLTENFVKLALFKD